MAQPEGSVPGNWAVVSTQRSFFDPAMCRTRMTVIPERSQNRARGRLPAKVSGRTLVCGSVPPGLHSCPFTSAAFGIVCLPDFWPARAPQPPPLLRALPITCSQPRGVSEPRTLPISPPVGLAVSGGHGSPGRTLPSDALPVCSHGVWGTQCCFAGSGQCPTWSF